MDALVPQRAEVAVEGLACAGLTGDADQQGRGGNVRGAVERRPFAHVRKPEAVLVLSGLGAEPLEQADAAEPLGGSDEPVGSQPLGGPLPVADKVEQGLVEHGLPAPVEGGLGHAVPASVEVVPGHGCPGAGGLAGCEQRLGQPAGRGVVPGGERDGDPLELHQVAELREGDVVVEPPVRRFWEATEGQLPELPEPSRDSVCCGSGDIVWPDLGGEAGEDLVRDGGLLVAERRREDECRAVRCLDGRCGGACEVGEQPGAEPQVLAAACGGDEVLDGAEAVEEEVLLRDPLRGFRVHLRLPPCSRGHDCLPRQRNVRTRMVDRPGPGALTGGTARRESRDEPRRRAGFECSWRRKVARDGGCAKGRSGRPRPSDREVGGLGESPISGPEPNSLRRRPHAGAPPVDPLRRAGRSAPPPTFLSEGDRQSARARWARPSG